MRQSSSLLYILMTIASVATIGPGATRVAALNYAPPNGAILDLSGLAVPHTSRQVYTVTFTAPVDSAPRTITFAFRDDPWFIQFSDVSLVDVTAHQGQNLLVNGDFSQGANGRTPVGWTYNNIDSQGFSGSVRARCVGSSFCWKDGAVQGYDELSQSVTTTGGDEYQLSFYAMDTRGPDFWSAVSTNGNVTNSDGNGADVLAYVQGIDGPYPHLPSATAPELSTWAMMTVGFLGLGVAGLRRASRRQAAQSASA